MNKRVFISSSIPYVNARPHIGHALEFVQADILARHKKLVGENVFLTAGTDDNALKNVLKAEEAGEKTSVFVKKHADVFRKLVENLDMDVDYFTETSNDEKHISGAKKLWKRSFDAGDIYLKEYEGMYCVGCEEFKMEKDLNEKGECPEHPGKPLEKIEEKNYFFKLSKYQDKLIEIIESGELLITPKSKKNEILSFIKSGLSDFSISRSVERARGWGIPVPNDDTQVMYVWFDALSNYINALGYGKDDKNFIDFWENGQERIHVVGKGINRFHTVYWPAMLLSVGVKLPTRVFVHGYFTVDGQKMSKSIGNVINPEEVIKKYGTDAVRYYFARHAHPFEDSDFTMEKFHEAYTANLVNGLGNLVSRVMKLAEIHLEESVKRPDPDIFPAEYSESLENFEFNKAADYVWKRIGDADQRMTDEAPFKVVKTDKEKGKKIISELAVELYKIARLLSPIMPSTSKVVKEAVVINKKPENLFPRISLD